MSQQVANLLLLPRLTATEDSFCHTRAVPLGGHNRMLIELLLAKLEDDATPSGYGIKCYPQYSNDLAHWVDASISIATLANRAPYRTQKVFDGPTIDATYTHFRVYFDNTQDKRAAVSAWVTLYTEET